ncbi:MAG TPA: peptidylprolyl isomerase [Cyanobacteria bacterium UBA8803]|nr:peptidylprolyl isomerase [Cyanobacteria bacterium UBA9273]HBL61100.1 peptidylprolyl isomerase [Cyanobacteria bacterium UBA8803]
MDINNFVTLDSVSLSLEQSLSYLRTAGKLSTVILEIAQQYILENEIQALEIPEPEAEIVEQFILEFRLQQQLTSPESFQKWLLINGISYEIFKQQVSFRIKQENLKEKVTALKVQKYFVQNQDNLDRVVLSRIVVDHPEVAQDLKEQVEQQGADFTQLAKKHSMVDDAVVGGVMGPIIRSQMPEIIRKATENAQLGQIIGPIKIEGRYCLLKVEQLLPAVLEGSLKRDLETHLFEEWLKEKLQSMNVQLNWKGTEQTV